MKLIEVAADRRCWEAQKPCLEKGTAFLLFVVGVVNKSNYSAHDKSRRDNGKSTSEHYARRKCNTYQHVYVNVTDFNVGSNYA